MLCYRTRSVAVALLMALFCGLAAGRPVHAAPPESPFAGSWDGTFILTGGVAGGGHLSMDIAANGLITGHATHYPSGISGPLVGHVNDDGFGAFVLRDQPDFVIPYLLFVWIDDDGNLNGVAPGLGWAESVFVEFVIAPQ